MHNIFKINVSKRYRQAKMRQLARKNALITWGEPAIVTQSILDKCCPVCGSKTSTGLDLGFVRGICFGATCICGFSF